MQTSIDKMKRIRREIVWVSGGWFLLGLSYPLGKWLEIESLKPQKDSTLLWIGFGGVVVIFIFLADCTDAILARIDERLAALLPDSGSRT